MKSILDYIKQQYNESLDYRIHIQSEYDWLMEYYSNNIPNDIMHKFQHDNLNIYELLNENLKSHDYKKLENKLYSTFKNDILGFKDYQGDGDKKSFIIQVNNVEISTQEDFLNILMFYNYYVKHIDKHDKLIYIGPLFSSNKYDYVWVECHGKGYHFTDNKTAEYILKNGLKIKNGNNEYPNRVYMFATNKKLESFDKKYINTVVKKSTSGIQDKIYKYGLCILKIDLNKQHSNTMWYQDNFMSEKEAVFTMNNIPAKCISKYQTNIFESKGEDIDEQWLNDDKPVMTHDGRPVIITKIDMKEIPNIIHGQVKMKEKLFDYEWQDDGMCIKALDQMGNPKKPDEADKLIKAS